MEARGGCLWWIVILTTMLVGCLGFALISEATTRQCPDGNFTPACASRVKDLLTGNHPAPPQD